MDAKQREEQIKIALSHLKYNLKMRGDDPAKYNKKYLLDKATKLIDDWVKDNPGKLAYSPIKGDE